MDGNEQIRQYEDVAASPEQSAFFTEPGPTYAEFAPTPERQDATVLEFPERSSDRIDARADRLSPEALTADADDPTHQALTAEAVSHAPHAHEVTSGAELTPQAHVAAQAARIMQLRRLELAERAPDTGSVFFESDRVAA